MLFKKNQKTMGNLKTETNFHTLIFKNILTMKVKMWIMNLKI